MSAAMRSRVRRGRDALVVAAFLFALAAPTLDELVRDDLARGPAPEMRAAAKMPNPPKDLAELSAFPPAYEAHFADKFGLRDKLLRWHSMLLYYAFGQSPTDRILVGGDGWLFWNGDNSADVFRGAAPLSAEQLAGWQNMLESRARALAKLGCEYVWVIAPNKETIYPEHMPDRLHPFGPTRLDQFSAWMKEHSSVDVLDLRPAMLAEKAHDTGPYDAVSTPFGTHWMGRGSLVAAREIVDHLARARPASKPFDPGEFRLQPIDSTPDSLAGNLYMTDLLRTKGAVPTAIEERSYEVIERQQGTPEHWLTRARSKDVLPPAVLFHDSFGPFVWPLLASHFETLSTFQSQFDPRLVDPARTRIVVELFVERVLVTIEPGLVAPDFVETRRRYEAATRTLFDMGAKPDVGKPIGGMALERIESEGHPALRMTLRAPREGLELGPMSLPARGEVLARVEADCSEACLLDVAWRSSGSSKYLRRDRATIALEAGRTVRVFTLPSLGSDAFLLVRPRENGVTVTLHAFSLRATQ